MRRMSRRLATLLLALLLPLQFAWGAAAAYCGHETNLQAAQHFGHHQHVHQTDAGQAAEAKKAVDGKLAYDNDCGSCHASATVLIAPTPGELSMPLPASGLALAVVPSPSSALARAPDRPQWLRLA